MENSLKIHFSLLKLIDKVKKGEKDKRMVEEFEYLIDILSDVVYQETIDFNSIRLLSYCTIPRPRVSGFSRYFT